MAEIAGLKLIVPSSVSSSGSATVSVSASGKVTFADIDPTDYIDIFGIFSASYDNYLMVLRGTATNVVGVESGLRGRLLASTTPASGTDYTNQFLNVQATTVSGRRDTSETWLNLAGAADAGPGGQHMYFYGPYLSQPTASRVVHMNARDGARILDTASTHSLSTSYDGIRFLTNANKISGALTIYGLSQ